MSDQQACRGSASSPSHKGWYKRETLINLNSRLRVHGKLLPKTTGTLLPGIETGPAIQVSTNPAICLYAVTILRGIPRDSLCRHGSKNPHIGPSVAGMVLVWPDYLLFLFAIIMVARDRIELPTRGFSGPVKSITY